MGMRKKNSPEESFILQRFEEKPPRPKQFKDENDRGGPLF
jgi:hypothetical protein